MKSYKIKQVAQMAGVSIRTLHHYDQIGLLRPAYIGENNYRFYTRAELMRLQQILFFKEMGLSLHDIGQALEKSDSERAALLRDHKVQMEAQARRQQQLIRTIDRTIAELNGEEKMHVRDLYKGFSAKKQNEYEQWLIDNHGPQVKVDVDRAREKFNKDAGTSKEHLIKQRMAELADIEGEIILALQGGVAANEIELEGPIRRHHKLISKWWGKTPDQASYIGLSQLYKSHPDFKARFEALAPGLTEYLAQVMVNFAKRNLS